MAILAKTRFVPSFDNSENRAIVLVETAAAIEVGYWRAALETMKQRNDQWLRSVESSPGKLDSHFFYTYYSAMLHLSSCAISLHSLCDIKLTDKRRWLFAEKEFTSAVASAFFALDMIVHLDCVKADHKRCVRRINNQTWDWRNHYFCLTQPSDIVGSVTAALLTDINVWKPSVRILKLREWFRDRPVHRQFHYVVERRKDMLGESKAPWCVLSPNMNTRKINIARDKVNIAREAGIHGFNWDVLPVSNFICTKDETGECRIIPAEDVIRVLLCRAADALASL